MSSSSASLGWVTCCSSQLLESIAHFGSQTNRNQASATENVARRGDISRAVGTFGVSFGCCLENCMHVAQSAVSSSMSLDIPGQNKLSLLSGGNFPFPCVLGVLFATSVDGTY